MELNYNSTNKNYISKQNKLVYVSWELVGTSQIEGEIQMQTNVALFIR